jgi:FkbM family methyltransferase
MFSRKRVRVMFDAFIRAAERRLKSVTRRVAGVFQSDPDVFLKHVIGVIHIGANEGQERKQYEKLGLQVVWVEPIPEIFSKLQSNIAEFPRQKAFQYLLTDEDGKEYEFNISSNNGASSSILELGLHPDIWPDVKYVRKLVLHSSTLPQMIEDENIDISRYQALVLDTQGSELLILKGAENLLSSFRSVKTEVPDFEAYKGCCVLTDLTSYPSRFGFREVRRTKFAERKAGGSYYDVVYRRY